VPNGDRRGNWKLQTLRHVGTAQTDVAASQFRSGAVQRIRHGLLVYSGGCEIRPDDGKN
jgi:hypothetical protein